MERRLFLKGLAGVIVGAPAVVSSASLMKIIVPKNDIIVQPPFRHIVEMPEVYGFEMMEHRLEELRETLIATVEDDLYKRIRMGRYHAEAINEPVMIPVRFGNPFRVNAGRQ